MRNNQYNPDPCEEVAPGNYESWFICCDLNGAPVYYEVGFPELTLYYDAHDLGMRWANKNNLAYLETNSRPDPGIPIIQTKEIYE